MKRALAKAASVRVFAPRRLLTSSNTSPNVSDASRALVVGLQTLHAQYAPHISRFLNASTGYDLVAERKRRVEEKDADLKDAMRVLEANKINYEQAIDDRRRLQKELNSLLQRKDSWVDEDIHRFTVLYRKELSLETAETTTKQEYKKSSDAYDATHQEYLNQIRERYIDEQLYSDKIRSASTWWTVGLISVHLAIFLMVSIRDPFVKKRDRKELVALVQETLRVENATLQSSVLNAVREAEEATRKETLASLSLSTTAAPVIRVGELALTHDQTSFLAGIGIGAFVSVVSILALGR
ncbi:sensitivity to high expression protein she9 [Podochytrium sp. JEL0797]|nr:sensitivity to high expression protein she9 [Podochytrium sp. JEL0797]